MNKLLFLLFGIFFVGFVSAEVYDWENMGPSMMYNMYGMGFGFFGVVLYLLVITNLVFLAIFLYKKNWVRQITN